LADKAVTLVSGASTLGNLIVNGQISANTFVYKVPKTVRYYFDSHQVLDKNWTTGFYSLNGNGVIGTYFTGAIPADAIWPAFAVIPIETKNGFRCKKIMGRFRDTSTGAPNVSVCIAYRDLANGDILYHTELAPNVSQYGYYEANTKNLSGSNNGQDVVANVDYVFNTTARRYFFGIAFGPGNTPATNCFEFGYLDIEESETR